jgi:hypothetical protein
MTLVEPAVLVAPPLGDSAKLQWRPVADQLRPKVPKLAALMGCGEVSRFNKRLS